jgi:tetratricopeptide (TPR) repeat protein
MRKVLHLLWLVFLLAACHPKNAGVTTPPPPATGPTADELAYQEGLAAFRLATPEAYQRAVSAFRKASELNKDRCEYTMHLAESLYFLAQQQKLNWEEYGDAVGEANAVVEFRQGALQCKGFESYLARLRALGLTFTNSPTAMAIAEVRHAIDLAPEDVMNWVVLAQLSATPLNNETISPIEHAATINPDLPVVQYELGNFYLRNQPTYPQATKAFERAVELSPRHFQAIIGIVYSLSPEGDDAADRIEALLHRAVEIAPGSLKARTLLGDYFAGMEETDEAAEQYSVAIASNGKYYPAHLAKGTTLVMAERSEDAEKSFNAVIDLEVKKPHPPFNGVDYSADAQAHYYLGNIWLDRGDLGKARIEYTEALNDIGGYGGPIYGLGIVSYREGKVDEALRYLDQVIQINAAAFPNAFLARGGIRAERRQFSDALRDFDSAIQIYQQQSAALAAKAKSDEAKGYVKRAQGEQRRKALIDVTLEKALESKKAVESLGRADVKPPRPEFFQ